MMGATGLTEVTRFTVTEGVIANTIRVLLEAGSEGYEAFVLWGGTLDDAGTTLDFTSAVRPWQRAEKTEDGLLVTVPSKALFQVNKLLYERGEILAAQVHSHPGRAFHSGTDDAYPLATLVGALSAVVPDFAFDGRAGFERWGWYRLVGVGVGRWAQVDPEDLVEVRP